MSEWSGKQWYETITFAIASKHFQTNQTNVRSSGNDACNFDLIQPRLGCSTNRVQHFPPFKFVKRAVKKLKLHFCNIRRWKDENCKQRYRTIVCLFVSVQLLVLHHWRQQSSGFFFFWQNQLVGGYRTTDNFRTIPNCCRFSTNPKNEFCGSYDKKGIFKPLVKWSWAIPRNGLGSSL